MSRVDLLSAAPHDRRHHRDDLTAETGDRTAAAELVKLASEYDRIHQGGAELVAVSVDDDVRQAGMAADTAASTRLQRGR